jgi:beta-hydroxylase
MLNNNNFLDPENFPFLKQIKDNFQIIHDEFIKATDVSQPWEDELLYDGKWDVIGLKYENINILDFQRVFPKTTEIFNSLPNKIYTYGFSIMRPSCEIHPHVNIINYVLRGHLCLSTNDNCALIVNEESRNWQVGELLVFDDTMLHSAYNRGNTDRVVLLFDFYK